MKTLYKSLTKLPNSHKTVYYFDKNGLRKEKTVEVTDRYLLVNARDDSIALTKEQLSKMGISVAESSKIVENSPEDDENPTENVTQSSPNSNDGENKNG